MAIRTREEILNAFNERFGSTQTADEYIAFLEDLTDTLQDYETRTQDSTNWQNKYNENDAMWRKRYHDRFFSSPANEQDPDPEPEEKPKALTFEALFKEV